MKRILAFVLALVMCLGLAACSGGSAPKNENSVSQSESTSDRQMPGEDEYYDWLGDAKETAYEVVSTDAQALFWIFAAASRNTPLFCKIKPRMV